MRNVRLDYDIIVDGIYVRTYMRDKIDCMRTRADVLWASILQRTSQNSSAVKDRKTSYGQSFNKFSDFQEFASWANSQVGYLNKESNGKFWQLDKDICVPFNKDYSSESCCFVPNELNCILTYSSKTRGEYPIGVHMEKRGGKFVTQASENNIRVWLGQHSCKEEAHRVWQLYKIDKLRQQAITWSGLICKRTVAGLNMHADIIYDDFINYRETIR